MGSFLNRVRRRQFNLIPVLARAVLGICTPAKNLAVRLSSNNMVSPVVSVIMTARNEAAGIGIAISSILSQTLRDFELIVVDDGSSDDTGKIAAAVRDDRVRLLVNDPGIGISASRNRAISVAKGRYIAVFDADDVSVPERLCKQVELLDANPELLLCGSWGIMKSESRAEVFKQPASYNEILASILKTNPVINSTIMARTEVLKENLYNPDLARHEDYDLILRVAKKGKILNIPEPLVEFETSHSFKYRIREHYWKTVVRLRAFFLYGYSAKILFWILPSLVVPFIPYALKMWFKKKLV